MMTKRILITAGEPAGVGPDLIIKVAQSAWPVELIVIGDQDLLLSRARLLNLPISLQPFKPESLPQALPAQHLCIINHPLRQACQAGILNPSNAMYVITMLEQACTLAQESIVHALVTTPVHKGILNQAGYAFSGHTEYLAQLTNTSDTLMLFVSLNNTPSLRLALATTHLPLSKVPEAITKKLLMNKLKLLRQGLQEYFHIPSPKLLVCGLNPHAGEGGYLGSEEIEIINPVISMLRSAGWDIMGPVSADTVFNSAVARNADAILAMYHDQALPAIKALHFNNTVNLTIGLPFIRSSVDHGTALDVAGTERVNVASLQTAITLTTQLLAGCLTR